MGGGGKNLLLDIAHFGGITLHSGKVPHHVLGADSLTGSTLPGNDNRLVLAVPHEASKGILCHREQVRIQITLLLSRISCGSQENEVRISVKMGG